MAEEKAMTRPWKLFLLVLPVAMLSLCVLGCAQQQATEQGIVPQQVTQTPTDQQSRTGTEIRIRVDPWNGPGSKEAAASMENDTAEAAGEDESVANANEGTLTRKGPRATYTQNVVVWVDTSASGSSGATSSGTASGSQTASGSMTTSAEQKPEAAVNISLPVGIGAAPRIVVDQAQAYKGDAGTGGVTADQSGDVFQLKALADRLGAMLEAVKAAIARTAPPATAPAAAGGG
jgi:hypothetical protein